MTSEKAREINFFIFFPAKTRLKKARRYTKITTLWKLANAFGLKFSQLAKLIEEELPNNFNFYD